MNPFFKGVIYPDINNCPDGCVFILFLAISGRKSSRAVTLPSHEPYSLPPIHQAIPAGRGWVLLITKWAFSLHLTDSPCGSEKLPTGMWILKINVLLATSRLLLNSFCK